MCSTGTCDDCLRNVAILSGLPGRDGIDGNRIQIGTGAPNDADYTDDDFYIDRNPPLNFYHKVAGAWTLIGRLQGVDGNGFLYQTSTLITSAELLNSAASPVIVTQVPPANYVVVPVSIVGSLHYNSVPYVAPYGVAVVYNNGSSNFAAAWASFMVTNTVNTVSNAPVSPQLNMVPGVALAVKPNSPGTLTAGNSDLLVTIVYYITPL